MTSRLHTYTTVERLFETSHHGIARVATRRSDGGYDSIPKTVVDAWCIYAVDDSFRFNHYPSFDAALDRIRELTDEFATAAVDDAYSLANTLAYGHELGRVLAPGGLFANVKGLDLKAHAPKVASGQLRFSVFTSTGISFDITTPPEIVRYTFTLADGTLALVHRSPYPDGE